jgi:hypothetical protein
LLTAALETVVTATIVTVVNAAIVTTWVFKKKRSKYFHESGLSGIKMD